MEPETIIYSWAPGSRLQAPAPALIHFYQCCGAGAVEPAFSAGAEAGVGADEFIRVEPEPEPGNLNTLEPEPELEPP